MSRRVVVVGDVAVDVVARLAEPVARGTDASATITMAGGGSGANVAWWLARQGVPVTLVGRTGDDEAGRSQLAALRAAGVDTAVTVDREHATGVVVVLVEPGGERTMLPDRGANLALAPADVPADTLAEAAHLHLSGYALLDHGPREAALAALDAARRAGLTTSVNPSSVQPLARTGPAAFLDWTAGMHLSIGNLDEARLLTGEHDAEACARALGQRYGAAVVTLGAAGALWVAGGRLWRSPPAPPTPGSVDTTGAGDAFTAGVLASWLDGTDPRACLERGAALAAEALTNPGARPAPR